MFNQFVLLIVQILNSYKNCKAFLVINDIIKLLFDVWLNFIECSFCMTVFDLTNTETCTVLVLLNRLLVKIFVPEIDMWLQKFNINY